MMNTPPELPASEPPVVPARRKFRWWIPVVTIILFFVANYALTLIAVLINPPQTEWQYSATVFARQIEQAVNSFYTDNQTMPAPENTAATKGGNLFKTDSPEGLEVVNILAGSGPPKANPRQIKYLIPRKANSEKKNGAIHDPGGSRITGLYDPWGNPYLIILDTNYEERVVVPLKAPVTLNGRHAAVYSAGPDGILETKDDIKTWP
jgi:hypothetical protein